MMKKINKVFVMVLAVIVLCISVMPIAASAASALDAGGILAVYDSSGNILGSFNCAAVTNNGKTAVFTSSVVTDEYTCKFFSLNSGQSTSVSYAASYNDFSVFFLDDTSGITALQMGNWSGNSDITVMYCDASTESMTSADVTVASNSNGLLTLQSSVQITTGAAMVDPSSGTYIGMVVSDSDSNTLYGLTTGYMSAQTESSSSSDSGSGSGSDSGNGSGGDSGNGSGDTPQTSGDTGTQGGSTGMTTLTIVAILALAAGAVLVYHLHSKSKKSGVSESDSVVPTPDNTAEKRICICGQGGLFNGRRFELDGSVTIGRQAERCNICYPNDAKGISGLHCQLRKIGNQIELIDLGSSYGTFVNGQKLSPNIPVRLNVGDRFWLASEKNTFVVYG